MTITVTNKTPNTMTLEMMRVYDVYGSVLVTKGWV